MTYKQKGSSVKNRLPFCFFFATLKKRVGDKKMKLQEIDINRAQGIRLCEELNLNNTFLPKNYSLTRDDITLLKKKGYRTIFGAWAESGDIDFDTALGIVAAQICGQNIGFRVDERGFCEIAALKKGIFEVSPDRLSKFNRFSESFVLNTISPLQLVKSGDILARLEIMTPIIPQVDIDDLVLSLSGNDTLLQVRTLKEQKVSLLYTQFYHNNDESEHFREVTEKLTDIYQPLNFTFNHQIQCDHTIEDISYALDNLLQSSADVIFIISGMRNYTSKDVLYTALNSLADSIICSQIPVFGGSDLLIATKKKKRIICLPYNYAFIDSSLTEEFIRLALIKPKLLPGDFSKPSNTFIEDISHIKDVSGLISGSSSDTKSKANIAAVVLAAGQSKRLGKNKLLLDVNGEPLALKAVRAAVQSLASPVFVVTGYQAEELEEALENFDINIIYNPNYYTGIKTSIRLGIQSVPDSCDGVLLIPADMPNLSPDFLNKLISQFRKRQEKQLILAERNGVKSNPVLWRKTLYHVADLVPENADVRPIFMEHADYTTTVKGSSEELLDINFQNDLDILAKISKA